MKTQDKKKVADVLKEKARWFHVGWLWFRAKPLTLGQIYEMGAVANDINAADLTKNSDKQMRIVSALVDHHNDARLMQRIFIICMFRSGIMRLLFGWYIRHRLTATKFQEMMNYIAVSFNANFFLTSIIFLRQTVIMTEPSPTTALGQLSEE